MRLGRQCLRCAGLLARRSSSPMNGPPCHPVHVTKLKTGTFPLTIVNPSQSSFDSKPVVADFFFFFFFTFCTVSSVHDGIQVLEKPGTCVPPLLAISATLSRFVLPPNLQQSFKAQNTCLAILRRSQRSEVHFTTPQRLKRIFFFLVVSHSTCSARECFQRA